MLRRYRGAVVGSPFGELEPLHLVLGGLSRWIEAPVVVAHHLGPSTSLLADVLDRGHRGGAHTLSGGLPVRWAVDGGTVEPGVIHLCPPQSLVRWEPGDTFTVRRLDGRSSFELLDEMLSSAADALGSTLLAVVLTGAGSDGTTGARAVWDAGGAVVAEDAEGAASELPNRVIGAGLADVVLPLPEISKLLNRVIGRGAQLPLPDRHRRAALVTCEIRATADPGNAAYQRDLAFTHDKLGDLADAIGDDTAADQHHRSALSIREWLAAAHPDRPEYQRDLATSHDKLGDADEFGHEGTAEHHYRAALTIRERLAAAHPDNAVPDADVTDVTELCIRPAPR